jgi:ABC-2 type transport system permease protein
MSTSRAIWLVAMREAVERARSRAYIVSTAITVIVLAAIVVITMVVSDDEPPRFTVSVTGPLPAAFDQSAEAAAEVFGASVALEQVPDGDAARAAVAEGRADAAVIGPHTVVVESRRGTTIESILDAALRQSQFLEKLDEEGLPAFVVAGILAATRADVESISEPPETAGEVVAVVTIILLFIVITMYGQWVLMGVLEEKTTKVVEQILSSVSVRALLAGKVIGIGVLGLVQMLIIVVGALVAFGSFGLFDLPSSAYPAAAWSILWFLLGFAFYATLYAAAASLVSRTEDAQASATPVALIGVAAYLATFVVVLNDPSSTLSRALSLFPPMAPIAFPARIGFAGVATLEILVGVAVMVAAVVAVTRLAARIYAGALLTSGSRVKLRQAWKASRELASR